MASPPGSFQAPWSVQSSQLWGRKVHDHQGRELGTIDSVVRTYGGAVRAIVRPNRRPRRFVFVDLREAVFDRKGVLVSSTVLDESARAEAKAVLRPKSILRFRLWRHA